MGKRFCRTRLLELQERLQRSGGRIRKKGPTGSRRLTGSKSGPTGLTSATTGLTGAPSKSGSFSESKTRPSFKKLLAKYEKEETTQKG